jgi:hypothetical protein
VQLAFALPGYGAIVVDFGAVLDFGLAEREVEATRTANPLPETRWAR